jgi:hypothetical protein
MAETCTIKLPLKVQTEQPVEAGLGEVIVLCGKCIVIDVAEGIAVA